MAAIFMLSWGSSNNNNMTRKDSEAIAAVIKLNKRFPPDPMLVANPVEIVLHRVVNGLADIMARDNARFDVQRFTKACGF